MKDDSFDCTLIAHLRIFLLFYRLLYCLILPENRLFFGIWKVVEIEKPFDLNVVTAKVQAVLRRAYALQGTANIIEHGEMLLNLGDASLTIAGQKIELTKNEFKICQMFFESAGKFVTRDAIMTRLWESDEFIDDNTLTVNVARLRKKLEEAGMHDVIRTKKGIGYMLV